MNNLHDDICKVLISEAQLDDKVAEIAAKIRVDYAGKYPLFISVLRGSFIFMADLVRKVDIPCTLDFMSVSSYGKKSMTTGAVKITKDLDIDVEGRHVIIVEDILDSGLTLSFLTSLMKTKNPASIKICTLLDKPDRRDPNVTLVPDYFGFVVPNEFVVGYGLDYADDYRNLPYIGILKPEVITRLTKDE